MPTHPDQPSPPVPPVPPTPAASRPADPRPIPPDEALEEMDDREADDAGDPGDSDPDGLSTLTEWVHQEKIALANRRMDLSVLGHVAGIVEDLTVPADGPDGGETWKMRRVSDATEGRMVEFLNELLALGSRVARRIG